MAQERVVVAWTPIRFILLIIAVLVLLLAAFHVSLGGVDLLPLGAAFGFGAFLVP